MKLDPSTALKSMAEILHNERATILSQCDNKDDAVLMWASACAQEAITIWRSVHPKMEREMLAEMLKTSQ